MTRVSGSFLSIAMIRLERMILLLSLLQVACQIDDFLLVLSDYWAFQRNDTGGIFIVDAVTGLKSSPHAHWRGDDTIHCQRPS